jgi:lisH domain-containing protein FOPNL
MPRHTTVAMCGPELQPWLMESVTDLKEVVRQSLDSKGILQQIKAQIRAEVYLSLEGKDAVNNVEKPPEVYLACELIRELFMGLDYKNSLAVFCEESGPPSEMGLNRDFLASELGLTVHEDDRSVPLLLMVIRLLKDLKAQRIDEEILG